VKKHLIKIVKPLALTLLFGIFGVASAVTVFADSEYIREESEYPAYYRTTANLRLRTGSSTDYDTIRTVSRGSTVRVYDRRDGEWYAVSHNGTRGYMSAEFLAPAVSLGISANGIETIAWSDARNNVIRIGVPLYVTDVRTGISFWMESFSNGSHADVIPRYREDTEAFRQAFGGSWSWEPRPMLVYVDGRTIAASMSGMPHGGFNSRDNGLVGHFCMHLQGSRTHNGNRSHENDHQNSVEEAARSI